MTKNQHAQNDLRAIKGIGPTRLGWLRDELGITSRRELAALTADALEARFQANNRSVPRSLIESWIAQAQEQTAGEPVADTAVVTDDREPNADPNADTDDWVTQATFEIVLDAKRSAGGTWKHQVTIRSRDTDEVRVWDAQQQAELAEWIAARVPTLSREAVPTARLDAGTGAATARDDQSAEAAPARAADIAQDGITLVEVRIFQPAKADAPCIRGTPAQLIARPVKADEPFTLDALYALSAPARDPTPVYTARFFARDLNTGEKFLLGESEPEEGEASQRLKLIGARLRPGTYRIQIALTHTDAARVDHLELPLLRVA